MFLKFESLSHPVRLAQGLKVLPHLVRVFAKWPFREVPGEGSGAPLINVMQDGDSYVLQAPWVELEQGYNDAAELADGLAGHLTQAWFRENPAHMMLKAAAATFGNDLVVFVGGQDSGKSLLVSCLAACGHTVFADSVLPVDGEDRCGIALGVAPRVRLPLPDALSGRLRELVAFHTDSGAEHFGYFKAQNKAVARLGDRAKIRSFVILDRRDDAPATLRPAADSTLLKRLLLGSVDGFSSTRASLDMSHELVDGASCHRLTWSDPQEAVNALRARFAIWRPGKAGEDPAAKKPSKARRRRHKGPRAPSGRQFRHCEGLGERQVDNDLFLIGSSGAAVYHLNSLGAGMWRLLDGSHGLDDVAAILRDAFPTVDRKIIEDDIEKLVADLVDRGLLTEHTTEAV